ncbi:short chain isoprenyl diphosphate synthase IdsA [Methanobacterium alcaliphilum]|uniref:short chain isoprenyl diphosphate synthase IdsA n=1 Tax=Methanobacterium alcaliphilum TaxID=392018 RepID=UPI00200A0CC8|nr:short chain isoprenyl diphosphate synthase IdsA [Methanobacterium alcaliphilum]MCK9151358.1 short chain isoprenyl diphosphate synthase IdsA [Methanobacterium alcaliphilum]
MSDVLKILKKYSESIDDEINEALSTISPAELREASNHLTKAGGKKLRPSLAVLSSEAVGGKSEYALKTAAAIELIHTFSLIHDDIMDEDDMRRGKPSVHVLWGEPMAILSGDIVFSKAFETVIRTKINDSSYERVNEALGVVVDSCIKICEGQACDMSFEERLDVNEVEYMDMIYKKTAALIAAATKAGAIMGGGNSEQVKALAEYGKLIGLAFQIQDDYLDVVSDEESLGKPVGSDIIEGKMTLMVVKALERASDVDKKTLLDILKEKNPDRVQEAIDIFEKYGSIQYAHDVALDNVRKAKELLNILDDSEAKDALILIADFVLQRQH